MTTARLVLLGFCALALGCESNFISNEPLPPVNDAATGGSSRPRDGRAPEPDEEPQEPGEEPQDPGEDPSPGADADGGMEPSEEDASMSTEDAGSEPMEPTVSKIKGSGLAAKCSSYGLQKGDKCAGYYCGITLEDLAAEYKPGNKCDTTPERICEGGLTRSVATCARAVKSNPLNALDTDEQIRAKVQTCVYNDSDNENTTEECLSCFLDAAQCASDNCLTQCLTGDSPTCDKCRLDNNCNQPVPTCAGFPTPF